MTDQERAGQAMRDAIQTWVRTFPENGPHYVVTDYVVCAASVDMATAGNGTTYSTSAPGPVHSALGLVGILEGHVMEGDDD